MNALLSQTNQLKVIGDDSYPWQTGKQNLSWVFSEIFQPENKFTSFHCLKLFTLQIKPFWTRFKVAQNDFLGLERPKKNSEIEIKNKIESYPSVLIESKV